MEAGHTQASYDPKALHISGDPDLIQSRVELLGCFLVEYRLPPEPVLAPGIIRWGV